MVIPFHPIWLITSHPSLHNSHLCVYPLGPLRHLHFSYPVSFTNDIVMAGRPAECAPDPFIRYEGWKRCTHIREQTFRISGRLAQIVQRTLRSCDSCEIQEKKERRQETASSSDRRPKCASRDSNPGCKLGRLESYPWTTGAGDRPDIQNINVNRRYCQFIVPKKTPSNST